MRHCLIVLVALAAAAAAAADQPQGRARLERQVRHELIMVPSYGVFDNFAHQMHGGPITLSGQVTRPTRKKDAERAVGAICGPCLHEPLRFDGPYLPFMLS
jgi:hyperosmotically inducible protein